MSQSTIVVPGLRILQYEIITSTKYFYKNPKVQIFFVRLIGAGGGGGSGRNAATGNQFGGEGGCSGGTVDNWILASELSNEELIEIGAHGSGGNGIAGGSTANGNPGQNGGATIFHGIAAGGGRLGRGGTSTGPTSTPISPPLISGGTSLQFNKSIIYTSGGVIPIPEAGHCGSGSHGDGNTTGSAGGGAGTAGDGGLQGDPGDPGLDASDNDMGGGSGGGGGFSPSSAGGNGGYPGGGGGGGAYGSGASGSGTGGAGADGKAFIIGWG